MTGKTDGMSRNQNMDAAMQRRVAEREARRTRRRQAREGVEITNSPYATHHEGLSSDDEETSIDVATFTAEKERILEEATNIWIDVWEEFGTVSGISIRFASWHKSFPAAYQQAFAALCLSRLLTPLIQIQLLRWNPLEPNCPDLESFPWFESLLFYGCDDIGSSITKEEKVDDDPDLEIIPSLVEKVVIPRLNIWDPMSTSQTERLVRTVTLIIKNYPTNDLRKYLHQALLKSILLRLRQAVDEDVFIPIYHKIVATWHGLLNATSLRELSLDGILNRYLLLSLQAAPPSSGLMQAQQVRGRRCFLIYFLCPPQLANLCRYIYHAATSIHRLAFGCPDTERRQARETVQQACQLLRSMGATVHATALTAECNPTPSTQSQAANTPSPATSILSPAAGPQHM
uniref:GCF C-terminal domain-containing protein n=1 Tax=Eptatretus burgeri TaxID=7764 RepID=A0A8C4Q0P3_EPTBU